MAGKVEEETAGGHSGETISSLLFRVYFFSLFLP